MSDELETMSNPLGDQALSVSDAAEAFRSLKIGKPGEARAEEMAENKPEPEAEAPAEAEVPEGAEVPGDDQEQPEEEPQETKRYAVKVNGVESKVSFEELRNGYQRDADYRQKMGELAKAKAEVDAQRQHYQQRIETFIPQLEQAFNAEFADIRTIQDVQNLAAADPARYVKWQAAQMTIQQARGAQQEAQRQAQEKAQQDYKTRLADEGKRLQEKLPELSDPEKGPKLQDGIRRYLAAEGFSYNEIENVIDHRAILIARKAMLFDQAQKARAAAAKNLETVPKVQKPGAAVKSNPDAERGQAAFQQLQKTGKVDAAANVFKTMKLFR